MSNQIMQNGNIEFIVEETIEGDSLEERFEHLYDNGGFAHLGSRTERLWTLLMVKYLIYLKILAS